MDRGGAGGLGADGCGSPRPCLWLPQTPPEAALSPPGPSIRAWVSGSFRRWPCRAQADGFLGCGAVGGARRTHPTTREGETGADECQAEPEGAPAPGLGEAQGVPHAVGSFSVFPSRGYGDTHPTPLPRLWGAGNKQPRESRPDSQASGLKILGTPGSPCLEPGGRELESGDRVCEDCQVKQGQSFAQGHFPKPVAVSGHSPRRPSARPEWVCVSRPPPPRPEDLLPVPLCWGHLASSRPSLSCPRSAPAAPVPHARHETSSCPTSLPALSSLLTATQTRDGPTFHGPEPALMGPPPPLLSPDAVALKDPVTFSTGPAALPLTKHSATEKPMPVTSAAKMRNAVARPQGALPSGSRPQRAGGRPKRSLPATGRSPGCPPRSAGSRPPREPPSARPGARWCPQGQRGTRSPEPHPERGRGPAAGARP